MHILSAGSNACGQLANGGIDDCHSFQKVSWSNEDKPRCKVKKIACGGNHTLILFENGQLWACGDGRKGQLGPIEFSHVFRPLLLETCIPDYQFLDVATSWETSYIVMRRPFMQDMLLTMGANDYGDRGIGTIGSKDLPAVSQISFESLFEPTVDVNSIRISQIASGPHHTIVSLHAQSMEGQLCHLIAGWGASRHGQLGFNGSHKLPLAYPSPRKLPSDYHAPPTSISAGNQHTVIVHSDGKVSFFGSNKRSQLECCSSPPPVQSVHCTWNGTCLVPSAADDELHLSGSNSHGQLGLNDPRITLNCLRLSVSVDGNHLQQVSTGSEHVLVHLKCQENKSLVLGWGWNEHGNLGLGHTKDVVCPEVIWPAGDGSKFPTSIESIWTGCGTSWIVMQ
jgi:protein ATS1